MLHEPIRLLIIDDCREDREHFRRLLTEPRDGRYVIFEAETGEAGRRYCRIEQPHVVLLDFRLPDTTGLELLPILQAAEHGLPAIIMVTAHGNETVAAEAMRQGAQDYLTKQEVNGPGLRSSIDRAIEGNLRTRKNAELRRLQRWTKQQLRVAGDIQNNMLPKGPPRITGFDIAGRCVPAEETGGDFFDFIKMPDGSIGIALGDVSGHGLGPAILASETRAYLRAFSQTNESPGKILSLTNGLLCEDTEGVRFVTLFLACLHPQSPLIDFASAGHRVYQINRDGVVTTIDSVQPPLGLMPELISDVENHIQLTPGEVLLLLTDGIPESAKQRRRSNPSRSMYGYERVLSLVCENLQCSSAVIIDRLFESVYEFTRRRSEDDDMTVVVIKATD